jgi:hypothetical protein
VIAKWSHEPFTRRKKEERDVQMVQELREKKRNDLEQQKHDSLYHRAKQAEDQQLQRRAVHHFQQHLLISFGFAPWMRYLARAR